MTRTRRLAVSYLALAAALAVLFALNLFWGSVSLAPGRSEEHTSELQSQ